MSAPSFKLQRPGEMSALERAGEALFRLRDYTPIPLVLLGIACAVPTPASLAAGLLVSALGEWIRTYGVAFIGTISRTRSYSNGELVTSGPFSLLRNPLYFGNLVLSVGLACMTGLWWLPLAVIAVFYAQYVPIVAWEEMKLRALFGERYTAYQASVPRRWIPPLGRVLGGGWYLAPDTWRAAFKSERRTLTSVLAFTALMLALFLWNRAEGGAALPLWGRFIAFP